jgi:hypothetical protein
MVVIVLPVIINHISKVVKERGLFGEIALVNLASHLIGDILLRPGAVNSPRISDHVKNQLPGRTNRSGSDREDGV